MRIVLCTAPATAVADKLGAADLAARLVDERLCACVNVMPGVTSWFFWQGKVDRVEEALLLIKTTAERLPALRARVQQLHPYEVPEFLELQVADGLPAYLQWAIAAVQPERS
ncbi:MAG: divalent-cation tolerance protein CutA [Planctomycetes bacterium]|nr:divalent-cation tolerance protein CutA [Planctomycetota bacterium]